MNGTVKPDTAQLGAVVHVLTHLLFHAPGGGR